MSITHDRIHELVGWLRLHPSGQLLADAGLLSRAAIRRSLRGGSKLRTLSIGVPMLWKTYCPLEQAYRKGVTYGLCFCTGPGREPAHADHPLREGPQDAKKRAG